MAKGKMLRFTINLHDSDVEIIKREEIPFDKTLYNRIEPAIEKDENGETFFDSNKKYYYCLSNKDFEIFKKGLDQC